MENSYKLLVSLIDPSLSEEEIKKQFESHGKINSFQLNQNNQMQKTTKRSAIIEFENKEQALDAFKNMNSQKIGNSRIEISKYMSETEFKKIQSKKLIIYGFPTDKEVQQAEVFDFFAKYGEIVRLELYYKEQKFQGSVQLLYESLASMDKLNMDNQTNKLVFVHNGENYTLKAQNQEDIQKQQLEKTVKVMNFSSKLQYNQLMNKETFEKQKQEKQEEIRKIFAEFGDIEDITVYANKKDQTNSNFGKLIAEIRFNSKESAEKVMEQFKNDKSKFNFGGNLEFSIQHLKQQTESSQNQATIFIKNLMKTEDSQDDFCKKLKDCINQIASVEDITNITQKTSNFHKFKGEPIYHVAVQMKSQEEAQKFLVHYSNNKQFKQFFLGGKSYQNVSLFQSKDNIDRISGMSKQAQPNFMMFQQQQNPQYTFNQQQQYMNFMMNPSNNYRNNRQQQQPFANNNGQFMYQQQQGGQYRQQQNGQGQRRNYNQNNNQPRHQ